MKSNIERNMVNKTLGNRFEAELCEMLAEHGFWAHNMAQNQTGQPADVIAARNEIAVLIDCKVCSNNTFPFSRIEPNQESAMDCWERCGNAQCYFALKLNTGEIYMAYWDDLQLLMTTGQRGLNESEIRKFPTFEEWVGDLSW